MFSSKVKEAIRYLNLSDSAVSSLVGELGPTEAERKILQRYAEQQTINRTNAAAEANWRVSMQREKEYFAKCSGDLFIHLAGIRKSSNVRIGSLSLTSDINRIFEALVYTPETAYSQGDRNVFNELRRMPQTEIPINREYGLKTGYLSRYLTTGSLPEIAVDAASIAVAIGINQVPEHWRKICAAVPVKRNEGEIIVFEGAPILEEIGQSGEVPLGDWSFGNEHHKVCEYALLFGWSEVLVKNADIRVMLEIPRRLAKQGARLMNQLVAHVLSTGHTSEQQMRDSNPLFSAAHENYMTGSDSALSDVGLRTAVKRLREQKSDTGEKLSLQPKFLVVPPALEFQARELLKCLYLPDDEDRIHVLVLADLTSEKRWFLMADPEEHPSIGMQLIDGNSEPTLTMSGSSQQGSSNRIDYHGVLGRLVFAAGCGPLDWRGVVGSAGE